LLVHLQLVDAAHVLAGDDEGVAFGNWEGISYSEGMLVQSRRELVQDYRMPEDIILRLLPALLPRVSIVSIGGE
jgi:hypothetical protein